MVHYASVDTEELTSGFQYPLYRIVEWFHSRRGGTDDRHVFQYPLYRIVEWFVPLVTPIVIAVGFSIRSIGSLNGSVTECATAAAQTVFQYPLYRIVEWFRIYRLDTASAGEVFQYPLYRIVEWFRGSPTRRYRGTSCFSIRSIGSLNGSELAPRTDAVNDAFQYPLYRIVEWFMYDKWCPPGKACFSIRSIGSLNGSPPPPPPGIPPEMFQYPLYRIVEWFRAILRNGFFDGLVSVSALSDR